MSDAAPGPLTKKLGGQPAWIWIVGVVIFAIGVQWYRQRAAAAAAAAAVTAPTLAQDPATMGTGSLPAGPGTNTGIAQTVMTTDQWLTAALTAAKNAGEDPIHASAALNNFLNGGKLTYADELVVNAALDAVGAPPGFSSIPQGDWATRGLPAPVVATPTRLIQPADQPGIFAQYSDGSVKWIQDPQELKVLQDNNPQLGQVVQLPVADPLFASATYGPGGDGMTGQQLYAARGGGKPFPASGYTS